jgi:hypothetical protein
VTPDLLGARHEFTFSGKAIAVEIPLAQENSTMPREFRSVECYKWRTEGNIPLEYQVKQIAMRIAVGHSLSIPEEALKVPPHRDELFTNAEREELQRLIDSLALLALDAFRHWLAVLRWISGVAYIGEPRVTHADDSSDGAALQESATRHRFWLQPRLIVVPGQKAITTAEWQSAQMALSQEKMPPIWFAFLFEGEQRLNNRDLIGAVLSLAIALESIIRNLVTDHLEKDRVEPLIFELVDRANLRSILSRVRNLTFWNQDLARVVDFSRFNELMDWRDRVMHSADTTALNEQDLRKTYAKLKKFAYFVSEYLAH